MIVHSSDVVGRAAMILAAWLPFMLNDPRYKNIQGLEARVNRAIEALHMVEAELLRAEGGKRKEH